MLGLDLAPPSKVSDAGPVATKSVRAVTSRADPFPSSTPVTFRFLKCCVPIASRCVMMKRGDAVNRQAPVASAARFRPSSTVFTSSSVEV